MGDLDISFFLYKIFPCFLTSMLPMLAKLTSKNQLTIPKAILLSYPDTEYFNVTDDDGRIVLSPVHLNRADAVRAKLADLGITEKDVADAVSWARSESEQT